MVLMGSGKPHAIISGSLRFVTQQDNDFFSNGNSGAAKHRTSHRRKGGNGIEHELMGNSFSPFEAEWSVACLRAIGKVLRHRMTCILPSAEFCGRSSLCLDGNEMQSVDDAIVESLILDLLEWLAIRDRNYHEVMNAWRTSCPKLPIWEEANDRGLVTRVEVNGNTIVRASLSGFALLEQRSHAPKVMVKSEVMR
jgi:hypothetical protein